MGLSVVSFNAGAILLKEKAGLFCNTVVNTQLPHVRHCSVGLVSGRSTWILEKVYK
jgi:hypothetical protein